MGLRIIFAVFFIGLGSVLYFTGSTKQRAEKNALQNAQFILDKAKIGEVVLVEGIVSPASKPLRDGLCLAYLEYYTASGRLDGWKIATEYIQPIVVGTPAGDVLCQFKKIPLRGEAIVRIPLEERDKDDKLQRVEGVKPASPLVAVGQVVSLNPFELDVAYSYLGSKQQYDVFLEAGEGWLLQICAGLGFLGFALLLPSVFYYFRKKEKAG